MINNFSMFQKLFCISFFVIYLLVEEEKAVNVGNVNGESASANGTIKELEADLEIAEWENASWLKAEKVDESLVRDKKNGLWHMMWNGPHYRNRH